MGYLRFRRSKSLIPGVRMNLSKSGVSWTLGPRGAHFTVGPRGTRRTVGLPGSGLSYTSYSGYHAHRASQPATRSPQQPAGDPIPPHRSPMMPMTKIVCGVMLAVLGPVTILTPIGIVLMIGAAILIAVGMMQRRKPIWRVRTLVSRASHHPSDAPALLDQALQLAPDNPEALAANADRRFHEGRWALAADLYERYLRLAPQDWLAEGHAASAWLNAGKPDAAIPHFIKVREHPGLTDDTRASVTAGLAMAFLSKGDAHQALDVAAGEPLQRHTLGEGMQRCLLLRGLAHYQLGQHSRGISDLDRLATMDPAFPNLEEVRNEMLTGTFSLDAKAAPAAATV